MWSKLKGCWYPLKFFLIVNNITVISKLYYILQNSDTEQSGMFFASFNMIYLIRWHYFWHVVVVLYYFDNTTTLKLILTVWNQTSKLKMHAYFMQDWSISVSWSHVVRTCSKTQQSNWHYDLYQFTPEEKKGIVKIF